MKAIRALIPRAAKSFLKRFLYRHLLTTSQAGQDYWIYGEAFNEKKGGYFLDVGAYNGIVFSNTYILESRYNWSGICIEANPIVFKDLIKNRRTVCLNVCLDKSEGEVPFVLRSAAGGIVDQDVDNKEPGTNNVIRMKTVSLNSVLEDQHAPSVIDYLSIDVEGAEERILSGFDFHKYTFRCVTIERPTELLKSLFKDHGYVLIKEISMLDCFYVHKDFLKEYESNLFSFYKKKNLAIHWRCRFISP
ncbi:MAG: FkbM family methyltransferase [Desulfobacteraceae bacterium]|nr:MAG: FkbM family methyltransferase [Desulfobacteraceae bacterium]